MTGLLSSEKVTVLDNLSTGNLENIPEYTNFICCDVRSSLTQKVIKDGHFDAIVHLAAQTMVSESLRNPQNDMENNVAGTVNILEAARKYKVKRVVFASSAAVYGDVEEKLLPVKEEEILRPTSFYGLSKMTCENYIRLYHALYGLSYVIFRFANVYGERQGYGGEGGVVSVFSQRLAEGRPVMIYGNGRQTRDFIHAGDIAAGIVKALLVPKGNITCNLSSGKEISIRDMADTLIELTGSIQPVVHAKKRDGDIFRSVLCNEKAKDYLGWKPEIKWEEGLARTYRYFAKWGKRNKI